MTGLKIGGVPEHFNLPWRLAIEERKFSEIGLNLHWSDMSGGTGQMIRGLESGSIDIAVLLTEGITKAIVQGLKAKIISVYVESPLRWGIHVPYDSGIQRFDDLKGQTFAISREGSGSHLMTYVKAKQEGWNTDALKFKVVGDIYGGLWALQNDEAQGFLWEKYTTHPFTEQKKCRFVDEVITPWPCFVIAVREEVLEKHQLILQDMCKVIASKAFEVKNDDKSIEVFAWRYNLEESLVKDWLKETEWNYKGDFDVQELGKVVDYLLDLGLIDEKEAENWPDKLV